MDTTDELNSELQEALDELEDRFVESGPMPKIEFVVSVGSFLFALAEELDTPDKLLFLNNLISAMRAYKENTNVTGL